MDNNSKTISLRVRNMMYEQQLRHLPCKDVDTLYDIIEKKVKPVKFAVEVHDKDIDDDGNDVEEHVHAMMAFPNPRSINSIASLLGDKPQYIQKWDGNEGNGFAYLVHRTDRARDKYQYDPSEVRANFDYVKELEKIEKDVKKAHSMKQVNDLLDNFYDGEINRKELEEQLRGSHYGKNIQVIKAIEAKRKQMEAEAFRRKMLEEGRTTKTIWIYGESGTGKTCLAKEIAEKKEEPFYIAGSSRDMFQTYDGEHTIILDEIRPYSMKYSDLLRITDPYAVSVMAPARYRDKYLASDLIIFTCPYNPRSYYVRLLKKENEDWLDGFDQLERRISMTLFMDETTIYLMEYSETTGYFQNPQCTKKNIYSKTARASSTNTQDATELFHEILDE